MTESNTKPRGKLLNLYQSIDIYGIKPEFFIDGSKMYQTLFGSFLTVLSFLLMGATGIYFFLQLFDTKNPIVIYSTTNPENLLINQYQKKNSLSHLDYKIYLPLTKLLTRKYIILK
jgi:hypothetical protein